MSSLLLIVSSRLVVVLPGVLFLQTPFILAVVDADGSFHVGADILWSVLKVDFVLDSVLKSSIEVHYERVVIYFEVC